MRKQDGRLDIKALRASLQRSRASRVRIKEAEAVRRNLMYKNERAITFERFCTKLAAMFTAYADNDEPFPDTQRIRLLMDRYSPQLETVKNTLSPVRHGPRER
jgi:hypothetical protein